MYFPRISLSRLFVLMMIILSMTLVMVSWTMYQNLAKESQKISLQELLSIESSHVFEAMEDTAEYIGMLIQSDTNFREAFLARDKMAMANLLDDQFHQHAVSSGGFDLIQLYVYDKSVKIFGWSHEGPSVKTDVDIICGDLTEIIKNRRGTDQLKIFTSLCRWQERAYFSVFLPIGGLKHSGYLQLVVDPLSNLTKIESILKLPLMIEISGGGNYYRSGNWQPGVTHCRCRTGPAAISGFVPRVN